MISYPHIIVTLHRYQMTYNYIQKLTLVPHGIKKGHTHHQELPPCYRVEWKQERAKIIIKSR